MGNKFKEVFSKKELEYTGTLKFSDSSAQREFASAIEKVFEEGVPVSVDGIAEMKTTASDGKMEYPLTQASSISRFVVEPFREKFPITINTSAGDRHIDLDVCQIKDGVIFEYDYKGIVQLKLKYQKTGDVVTFSYETHPEVADSIQSIIFAYESALGIIKKALNYNVDDESEENSNIKETTESFEEMISFFSRVYAVERTLNINFAPSRINDETNDEGNLEELYFLLVEKIIIRIATKKNGGDLGSLDGSKLLNPLEVGAKLEIIFLSNPQYHVYGQDFSVFSANLLTNAIVEKIEINEDGSTKIFYGDTDSEPLYISSMGFTNEEDAKKEMELIMKHKEKYVNAPTFNELMKIANESYRSSIRLEE